MLEKLSSDFIELEQFLDFVRNRKFRQTLLCHAGIKLQRKVGPEVVADLFVASSLKPVQADLDLRSTAAAPFSSPRGLTPSTSDPLLKSALVHLAEHWPQAVSFAALLDAARAQARPSRPQDQSEWASDSQILGKSLLQLYSANLLELHMGKFPFVRTIAEKPQASPLARLQAVTAHKVTNLRHESVTLGNLEREVLRHLDGSRTLAALVDHLMHLQARGALTFQQEGEVDRSPESIRKMLSATLERCLAGLAESALLTAG
jgi:methyltransferase-like protein